MQTHTEQRLTHFSEHADKLRLTSDAEAVATSPESEMHGRLKHMKANMETIRNRFDLSERWDKEITTVETNISNTKNTPRWPKFLKAVNEWLRTGEGFEQLSHSQLLWIAHRINNVLPQDRIAAYDPRLRRIQILTRRETVRNGLPPGVYREVSRVEDNIKTMADREGWPKFAQAVNEWLAKDETMRNLDTAHYPLVVRQLTPVLPDGWQVSYFPRRNSRRGPPTLALLRIDRPMRTAIPIDELNVQVAPALRKRFQALLQEAHRMGVMIVEKSTREGIVVTGFAAVHDEPANRENGYRPASVLQQPITDWNHPLVTSIETAIATSQKRSRRIETTEQKRLKQLTAQSIRLLSRHLGVPVSEIRVIQARGLSFGGGYGLPTVFITLPTVGHGFQIILEANNQRFDFHTSNYNLVGFRCLDNNEYGFRFGFHIPNLDSFSPAIRELAGRLPADVSFLRVEHMDRRQPYYEYCLFRNGRKLASVSSRSENGRGDNRELQTQLAAMLRRYSTPDN